MHCQVIMSKLTICMFEHVYVCTYIHMYTLFVYLCIFMCMLGLCDNQDKLIIGTFLSIIMIYTMV